MPNYIFKHPEEERYEEVFFHMNDEPKEYIDEESIKWERIFHSPQLNTVGGIDPWDNADFVNKTAQKKGTYGDLLDMSSELSEKRAKERGGVDPVKQKAYDDYAKKRGGSRHFQEIKEKGINAKDVKVDL
jgi:hypothetical protein